MRVVVTGGGTGGHIYPALAVAKVMQNDPDVERVVYIGKNTGLERELAATAGIAFEGISFYGMPRGVNPTLPFRFLLWLFHLNQAKNRARRLLKEIHPQVVFGTGGYVSAPVLLAAQSLGIPYVVHEPDAEPGLANRLLGRKAKLITTSFPEGAECLRQHSKQDVVVTGNPIREGIGLLSREAARERIAARGALPTSDLAQRSLLLITGGSQGSRRLNTAIARALPTLLNQWQVAVVHLTGRKLYDETIALIETVNPALQHHPAYWVRPYADDMDALLALADVAVCRAGSLSLSEMYVCGIPTLLVPYPFAASDHQRRNARASEKAGASLYLEDADCDDITLLDTLRPLIEDTERRERMREIALSLGHPRATASLAECLKEVAHVV
jgi:UDP-N-acetylglucosamine--N-acetylmuramyl-(pentapeptide) pyrophosphoryl-undecaprenol N-acetylglucosamine transferase